MQAALQIGSGTPHLYKIKMSSWSYERIFLSGVSWKPFSLGTSQGFTVQTLLGGSQERTVGCSWKPAHRYLVAFVAGKVRGREARVLTSLLIPAGDRLPAVSAFVYISCTTKAKRTMNSTDDDRIPKVVLGQGEVYPLDGLSSQGGLTTHRQRSECRRRW